MRLSAAGAGLHAPSPRLNRALLCSLLAHGALLSLTFGAGRGLGGLHLPWSGWDEEPELRVVLEPEPLPTPPVPTTPRPPAESSVEAAVPAPQRAEVPTPLKMLSGAQGEDLPPTPVPRAPRLTSERSDVAAWADAASAVPTAAVSTLAAASSPAVDALRRSADGLRPRDDGQARARAAALAQLDAPSEDARALPAQTVGAFASSASPAVERLRRSAAEALRVPVGEPAAALAQLDSDRQAAQQRGQRLEAARQEAQQAEAARADAVRQEADRQAAGRQEAARLALGRIEAARLAQAQAEAEQREARLRAIGRQLDEERARRDADRQRPDWAPARRGRLLGRLDDNEALMQYGEAWARKIQFNPTFELVREAARQPHSDPVVNVAVRSDGSVESVSFVRSSGVPALDEAVRRVVLSQERYPAFSPALLRDFDVVEIRRSWHFDTAIRLD